MSKKVYAVIWPVLEITSLNFLRDILGYDEISDSPSDANLNSSTLKHTKYLLLTNYLV